MSRDQQTLSVKGLLLLQNIGKETLGIKMGAQNSAKSGKNENNPHFGGPLGRGGVLSRIFKRQI